LQEAIERAALIYEVHKTNWVDMLAFKATLGFNATTSRGMRAVSALFQFGLAESRQVGGKNMAKLSDLCINVLLRREGDPERVEHLRKAALRPTIYGDIGVKWSNGLPDDGELTNHLVSVKGLNPAVADVMIRDLRATWVYACLPIQAPQSGGFVISKKRSNGNAADELQPGSTVGHGEISQSSIAGLSVRSYQMPLEGGRQAVLQIPVDVTRAEIDLISRYLSLMKEVLS